VLAVNQPMSARSIEPIGIDLVQNVPIATFEINKQSVRAAIDTGARTCYALAEHLDALPKVGEQEDFYPGVGRFTTSVHQVKLCLSGSPITSEVAKLPASLGGVLSKFGIEFIVGNNILLKDGFRINYAEKKLVFL
jgi:hypothetical protein